jgi:hypothetical protein
VAQTHNIYCDESCHLENDHQPSMVVGALLCPRDKAREVADRIREIKSEHGLGTSNFEIKWSKVSPGRVKFYQALIDYFFDDDDLAFRAVIVPDKTILDHQRFPGQTHDEWYYKMYFILLSVLLDPSSEYRIYLDIKDTRSATKVRKLAEVLASSIHDFERAVVAQVQNVRSDEVQQLQLVDLLIGAVSYANRGLNTSQAKVALVQHMRRHSGYSLTKTTWLKEKKVNLLRWQSRSLFS